MKREEEYKRLSEALAEDGTYNAVGFRYGSDYYDPSEPTEEEEHQPAKQRETAQTENVEENEEPFVAPPGLNVPSDVELPPTAKMHAIIERTANFVCKQGAQFEIMLKAKQARNSQFDFLRFDHYLNPYYKFIQKAMKEGRYAAPSENKADEKKHTKVKSEEEDDDDDDDDGNYLHPSLFASKKSSRLEELMKPLKVVDPDHPLAALVRKAQSDNNSSTPQSTDGAAVQTSQVEYSSDSTVAAMYYSYYMLPDGTYCLAPPPPGIDVATYYNALPAGVTVSSTTGVATVPPPPGTTPPPPPDTTDSSSGLTSTTTSTSTIAPVVAIIPPPPDIQPVIDKLAEYVARNGIKFETSVRAKNDLRFEFLQPWHQYNPYYEFKKQFFLQKESSDNCQGVSSSEDVPADTTTDAPSETQLADGHAPEDGSEPIAKGAPETKKDVLPKTVSDGKLVKASFAPISFAIKAKENDLLPLEKNRVKLDDDSDEEEEEGKEGQENANSASNSTPAVTTPCVAAEEKKPQLTQEELEAKQAKQKLEDRLAAAAREKLAQASKESKEKQLQAERKRKAALFLQTLKNPLSEAETEKVEENSFSVESVSSIPCPATAVRTLPTLDVGRTSAAERPSSKSRDPPRDEEKEKKRKKHKKRSRSRSRSPFKYHSSSKTRSRSHSKAKHSLPTAYRTVRHSRLTASTGTLSMEPSLSSSSVAAATERESYQAASTTKRFDCWRSFEGNPGKTSRSRSRSPRRRAHTPERRREERSVPTAYRISNSPGNSRKRARSKSPHEKKKKRRSRSRTKSRARSPSPAVSPGKPSTHKNSVHSNSVSPVESRESSQERSRGVSQEKDGQISSAIVSSVQSKITQDLMAKVRAMLAASKNIQTSAS
ncbi:splicing factor, suppressor of white-apricot homolog isoform X4 [Gallus gallus]|uniref:splicing factor, suppressor of white-apricot homolog isoform X4 n=1 Tax=Gallus gallus TaxID=9031 RepID=UPI001AE4B1BA|nr:splicing factor, suppressor of white-apricot homolog isoform X4 [Gallus gallus]XP_015131121.2 splicing factor, suppressor of white-apricot homolog isoform X4 [Gallus gallus]XP_040540300.1 splicing factor, suppressor of white-apricot homolog isoform X4 [Gallus gallus]XP_040540301.1 splicing factor, suppressor of white-apricot homolog isoform X4 [Gallus gallus]XP_046757199.1 splicing factor, suppressor of white-apricot homolog isoform X4 [Gallus gallus]XP_046784298.1 splicing factor, suppress